MGALHLALDVCLSVFSFPGCGRCNRVAPAFNHRSHPTHALLRMLGVALLCAFGLLLVPLTASAAAKTCAGKKVTIMGTPGDDVIVGKGASDVIYGGGGDDIIYGGRNGNDTICGGPGDDVI